MAEVKENCVICQRKVKQAKVHDSNEMSKQIDCHVCGKYIIDHHLQVKGKSILKNNAYILSGVIREANLRNIIPNVTKDTFEDLISNAIYPQHIIETIDKLLFIIANESNEFQEFFYIGWQDYPRVYSKSHTEFIFIIQRAMELGYIESSSGTISLDLDFRLTIKGINRLQEIKAKRVKSSNNVFIAMSFKPKYKNIYLNGYKKTLLELGFNPIRVDDLEHNEYIIDKIMSEIKICRFLIADLSSHNNGVYFEAGYAMGHGIDVISTCNKKEFESTHFDLKQFNILVWKSINELNEILTNRIRSTII